MQLCARLVALMIDGGIVCLFRTL